MTIKLATIALWLRPFAALRVIMHQKHKFNGPKVIEFFN